MLFFSEPKRCICWHFDKKGKQILIDTLSPVYKGRYTYQVEAKTDVWYYSYVRKAKIKNTDWDRMEIICNYDIFNP